MEADHDADDDRQLVGRAVDGDPDAWEAIYRRAYPGMFAFAYRRLGANHLADDAVSEAMVRAVSRIASFSWQGFGIDAWLFGILRNVVLEQHRRSRRETVLPDLDESTIPGPLAAMVEVDRRREVAYAFERLSPEEQEVLELRVVAGLSAAEVAAVLGRRPGAVRMAQSRALRRLAILLKEVSDDG